jgi:predicted chitinase
MKTLSERQLVAILASANASAVNAFIQAVDDISSGENPEERIQEAMTALAFAVNSGRLAKAAEAFGLSAQALDGGFLQLKEAVEHLIAVMPTLGQA